MFQSGDETAETKKEHGVRDRNTDPKVSKKESQRNWKTSGQTWESFIDLSADGKGLKQKHKDSQEQAEEVEKQLETCVKKQRQPSKS